MFNKTKFLFFFILNIVLTSQLHAFDSFLNSSRYKSMSGAGIASTSRLGVEDFGLINPAVLSTNADLVFSGGYAKGESQNQDLSGYSLSVVDSTNGAWDSKRSNAFEGTNGFPLASVLYYSNLDFDQFEDQYFHLGVSQPIGPKMSIGLAGTYSIMKSQSLNVSENVFDLNAGFLWRIFKPITLGFSAMNLMDQRDKYIPGYLRRSLGAGIEYKASESVKLRGDYWRARDAGDSTEDVFRVGVSNLITENFILQFGFADDRRIDTNILSVGFVLAGPRLTFSYSVMRETSYNNLLHSVDFRVPVW